MPDMTEARARIVEAQRQDELMRLIGVRAGYVHAIVKLKRAISFGTEYPPIDPRHIRKIKAQEDRLRIPREVLSHLERELDAIRAALAPPQGVNDDARNIHDTRRLLPGGGVRDGRN